MLFTIFELFIFALPSSIPDSSSSVFAILQPTEQSKCLFLTYAIPKLKKMQKTAVQHLFLDFVLPLYFISYSVSMYNVKISSPANTKDIFIIPIVADNYIISGRNIIFMKSVYRITDLLGYDILN